MENAITLMVKEVFLFNIWECFMVLSFILIDSQLRISKKQLMFHVFMLSMVNYLCSNLIPIPIAPQIIFVLILTFYSNVIFRIEFKKMILLSFKAFFMAFILEMFLGMVYEKVFNLQFILMDNNFKKFLYLSSIRCIEVGFIYLYYRGVVSLFMEKIIKVLVNSGKLMLSKLPKIPTHLK